MYYENEDYEINLALRTLDKIYYERIIKPYKNSEKIIDMYTFSKYSGGDLSPYELIRLAIEQKVKTLAITDYNTIEGVKNINRNDELIIDSGIEIINAVMLSGESNLGMINILGYGIDVNNKNLNIKMSKLKDNNINLTLSILEEIKKEYGIRFCYEDIKKIINANHNLGILDIVRLFIKYGYINKINTEILNYLSSVFNKVRHLNNGLTYQECIELIVNSGGIPVLYPKILNISEKESLVLLREMIGLGLKGIMVYQSNYSQEEIEYYLEIATKYNLLINGGSGFHSEIFSEGVKVGTGKNNNINIKNLSLLNELHKKSN